MRHISQECNTAQSNANLLMETLSAAASQDLEMEFIQVCPVYWNKNAAGKSLLRNWGSNVVLLKNSLLLKSPEQTTMPKGLVPSNLSSHPLGGRLSQVVGISKIAHQLAPM